MLAQKTTNISLVNLTGPLTETIATARVGTGTGVVSPFGKAGLNVTGTFATGQDGNATGPGPSTFTFLINQLDSFTVSTTVPDFATTGTFSGAISGGTGTFSGATGSATIMLTRGARVNSFRTNALSGSGSITVGSQTTAFTLSSFFALTFDTNTVTHSAKATANLTPFGSVTVNATANLVGPSSFVTLTFALNANDSFSAFLKGGLPPIPATITGGTGAFAGATGSLTISGIQLFGGFSLGATGTITQPAAGSPIITLVQTSGSTGPNIAQNAWIELKGTNLVPATTPSSGVDWSKAPELASGRMPTQLGGISVTVNGKPAYVYFYCSAATASFCPSDQINVLTPLDPTVDRQTLLNGGEQVPVVVNRAGVSSPPFIANMKLAAPSFLLFSARGDPVATHANFSLLGPTTLFPNVSTPAQAGETILLYGVGYGLPTTPLVEGSTSQSGMLQQQVTCSVGTVQTMADGFLISPGLYQLNLTVPAGVGAGDNPVACTYVGGATPAGDLIAVQ